MLEYTVENLTADEVVRLRAVYEPLTQSVRELVDATIRTQVDAESVAEAKAAIDAATARLRSRNSTARSASGSAPTVTRCLGATPSSVCATPPRHR